MRWKFARRVVAIGLVSFTFVSCGGAATDERVASRLALSTTENGDVIEALFSAMSSQAQLMSVSSGSLQGSSVLIPPGALTVDLSVSVSSTESIANAAQAADLGIANVAISAAGPSVLVAPSSTTELSLPMQLSIPITGAALALDDDTENYVVVYKAYALKDGQTIQYAGLIPRAEIVIANGFAKFKTTRFGAFQVAKTSVKVETAITQPATVEIGKKPGFDLVGGWRACNLDDSNSGSATRYWHYETFFFESDGKLAYENIDTGDYSSVDCPAYVSVTTPKMKTSIEGSFTAGGLTAVTLPAERSGDTRKIDFKVTSMKVTVYDDTVVYELNSRVGGPACGVTWALNQPQSLNSLACLHANQASYDGPVVDEPRYGIYNISPFTVAGQSVKFLLIEDGNTEATRPTGFNAGSGPGLQKLPAQ